MEVSGKTEWKYQGRQRMEVSGKTPGKTDWKYQKEDKEWKCQVRHQVRQTGSIKRKTKNGSTR